MNVDKFAQTYRFKQSFSSDITLSRKLFALLETTFPGISSMAQLGRDLGASWEEASTPFMLPQAARC